MDDYFQLKYQQEVFNGCFVAFCIIAFLLYVAGTAVVDKCREMKRAWRERKAQKQ